MEIDQSQVGTIKNIINKMLSRMVDPTDETAENVPPASEEVKKEGNDDTVQKEEDYVDSEEEKKLDVKDGSFITPKSKKETQA